MKEFLKNLPKDEALFIGVYKDKKGLAPLHCKRWLLSPRIVEKEFDFDRNGEL